MSPQFFFRCGITDYETSDKDIDTQIVGEEDPVVGSSFCLPLDLPVRLSVASALTGIPESSLREKVMSGEIRAKRDGPKLILIRLADLSDWFDTLTDLQSNVPIKNTTQTTTQRRGNTGEIAKRSDPLQRNLERPKSLRLSAEDL